MGLRGTDYIPRSDSEFNTWAQQFASGMVGWRDRQGLEPPLPDPVADAVTAWRAAYAQHTAAQAAAESATAAKAAARAACESIVRTTAALVQTFKTTTDFDRADLGITVPDAVRTPSPAPTTRPRALVEFAGRLTHTLRFSDESTPTRTAKPAGVRAAEVWVALGEPGIPPPMDAYRFLASATRGGGGLNHTFPSAEGGKTAYYQLRWVSTRGEKGPWSDVVTATVAA